MFETCSLNMLGALQPSCLDKYISYKMSNGDIYNCKKCTPEQCKVCAWDINNINARKPKWTKKVPKENIPRFGIKMV